MKGTINESIVKRYIVEELTKSEVSSMIDDKLTTYLRKSQLKNEVRDIVADVMEKFFRTMFNKRGFWKNDVKNG